jgi:hypothetical protein
VVATAAASSSSLEEAVIRHRECVMKVVNPELTPKERLSMAVLGLVGEWQEYITDLHDHREQTIHRDSLLMEMGDVCWYLQLLSMCTSSGFYVRESTQGTDLDHIGQIAEDVKKHLYHGRSLDTQRLTANITQLLTFMIQGVAGNREEYNDLLIKVLDMNTEKLYKRYPSGFVTGGGLRETSTGSSDSKKE